MYGLVHQAIEGLVTDKFGEEAWTRVLAQAGVDEEVFISNQSYPDDLTYRLIGSAHAVLELPMETILRAFGNYWVIHTAEEGYGHLLDASGRNLAEFLENLPNFHARVSLIYPELQPPTFRCTAVRPGGLRLHYFSHRHSLAPFVHGLVEGLATRYRTQVTIEQVAHRAAGDDHDEFDIEWPVAPPT